MTKRVEIEMILVEGDVTFTVYPVTALGDRLTPGQSVGTVDPQGNFAPGITPGIDDEIQVALDTVDPTGE